MPGSPKKAPALRHGTQTLDVELREDAPEVPTCPKGLLKRTRERWASYWSSDVARAVDPIADLHCVERWIHALDEYERVYPLVKRKRVVTGSQEQEVLNPLATYLSRLQREIRSAEAELGLTPMARLKLGITFQEARRTLPAKREMDQATREQDDPRRVLLGVG